MPSLPTRDGVVAPPSAGIRAGALTVSADATFNSDDGTSLPSPPTGEHNAFGGGSGGTFLSPLCALREHGGGNVPTRGRTIACMGQWHPRPLPQGRQRHCQARTALLCQLGHLPLHPPQREGGIT
jgi:hypothetical protein